MESDFNQVMGRIRLFPQIAFSVPFRYGVRRLRSLALKVAVQVAPSQFLPPVLLAAPPVVLVDEQGRQELLNEAAVQMHIMSSSTAADQALYVMEVPVSSWHSREVQFLRFYYRHIEPTRLGFVCPETGEAAWKGALREIMRSTWLQRFLRQKAAADGMLTNAILSQLLWHQVSHRTIANYKGELRKTCRAEAFAPTLQTSAGSAAVMALDDYR